MIIKQSELSKILLDLEQCKYILQYVGRKDLIDRLEKDFNLISNLIKELKK